MSPVVKTSYTSTLFQRLKKHIKGEKDPITQETGKKVLKGLLYDKYYYINSKTSNDKKSS